MTYTIHRTPGTGRYYVVIRDNATKNPVITLDMHFGWPTYDDAVFAATDWLEQHPVTYPPAWKG